MDTLNAKKVLEGMTLEECISLWNKGAKDNDMRSCEIHETDDSSWWEWLMNDVAGLRFVVDLTNSNGCSFNLNNKYFLYDECGMEFISFNTKDELIEIVSEDALINEVINRG